MPFRFDRFLRAAERAYGNLNQDKIGEKKFVFVKTEYRLERISLSDILFIEGMGDYRNVQTVSGKTLRLQTFSVFEKELPANSFCRVHKSYIIPIDKIKSIERNRIKILDFIIPIGDTYKEHLYRIIGINGFK